MKILTCYSARYYGARGGRKNQPMKVKKPIKDLLGSRIWGHIDGQLWGHIEDEFGYNITNPLWSKLAEQLRGQLSVPLYKELQDTNGLEDEN